MTNQGFSSAESTARAHELSAEAEHLYGMTMRRKATLLAAKERAVLVTGEAVSPDGSVKVKVDVGGMLTNLILGPQALQRGPDELAQLVTTVAQQAAASARATVREVYAPLRDEGVVRDMPLLLPEPAPQVARTAARQVADEHEASYEEAPSVLRSEDW